MSGSSHRFRCGVLQSRGASAAPVVVHVHVTNFAKEERITRAARESCTRNPLRNDSAEKDRHVGLAASEKIPVEKTSVYLISSAKLIRRGFSAIPRGSWRVTFGKLRLSQLRRLTRRPAESPTRGGIKRGLLLNRDRGELARCADLHLKLLSVKRRLYAQYCQLFSARNSEKRVSTHTSIITPELHRCRSGAFGNHERR